MLFSPTSSLAIDISRVLFVQAKPQRAPRKPSARAVVDSDDSDSDSDDSDAQVQDAAHKCRTRGMNILLRFVLGHFLLPPDRAFLVCDLRQRRGESTPTFLTVFCRRLYSLFTAAKMIPNLFFLSDSYPKLG